jgi:hypothetical protein
LVAGVAAVGCPELRLDLRTQASRYGDAMPRRRCGPRSHYGARCRAVYGGQDCSRRLPAAGGRGCHENEDSRVPADRPPSHGVQCAGTTRSCHENAPTVVLAAPCLGALSGAGSPVPW